MHLTLHTTYYNFFYFFFQNTIEHFSDLADIEQVDDDESVGGCWRDPGFPDESSTDSLYGDDCISNLSLLKHHYYK